MKKVPQAVLMTEFSTEMARCIPVDIFRVDVRSRHQHRLDHPKVASDASHVKRRPEIPTSCVNIRAVLNKKVN